MHNIVADTSTSMEIPSTTGPGGVVNMATNITASLSSLINKRPKLRRLFFEILSSLCIHI